MDTGTEVGLRGKCAGCGVRKLTRDETRYCPLAKLDCFCTRENIQCVHFQPGPNQFKGRCGSVISCYLALGSPYLS